MFYVLTLVFAASASNNVSHSSHQEFSSRERCENHKNLIVKISEERRLRNDGSALGLAIAVCSPK